MAAHIDVAVAAVEELSRDCMVSFAKWSLKRALRTW